MSTVEIIGLVATVLVSGGLATYLVQLIKRASWSSRIKWVCSIVVSGLFGLATSWLDGDVLGLIQDWGHLSAGEIWGFLGSVYIVSQGFYELYVKPKARPPEAG